MKGGAVRALTQDPVICAGPCDGKELYGIRIHARASSPAMISHRAKT